MNMQTIKTLVFEYTKIKEKHFLVTLRDDENPTRFIRHPLQFTFTKNPNKHFRDNSKLTEIKCKSI